MKINAVAFASPERRGLFQKLRLARPSLRHGTRINVSFAIRDIGQLAGLDLATLKRWAGPRLTELVTEVERAGRSSAALAEVTIAKTASGPEDAAALRRRAEIFGELVRFSIAERRLAEPARVVAPDEDA